MGITDGDIALALMEIDKRLHSLEQKVSAEEIKSAKLRANNQSIPCCQEFHQWCIEVKSYCHCPQCGTILF